MKILSFVFILFFSFQVFALHCYEANLLNAPRDFSCTLNSGESFTRHWTGTWSSPSLGEWYVPSELAYNFADALKYCEDKGLRAPLANDLRSLINEIKNPQTGIAPQLFYAQGSFGLSSQNTVWTGIVYTSALSQVWKLDRNYFGGSYYPDYPFRVVCIKK